MTIARSKIKFILFVFIIIGSISAWLAYDFIHTEPAKEWFDHKHIDTVAVSLPKDDAPHQAGMEWWYYNGHLKSQSGKQYSFHYTVFLLSNLMNHVVIHASLSNHQSGEHFTAQRRTGGNSSINTKDHFKFKQGSWIMEGGDGRDKLKVATTEFNFDLDLNSTQAPILYGKDGIISLDIAGSSYYYSRTRMAISGTIMIDGVTEKVTGHSWFDHQWGDFSVGLLSWDWFSLMLNNGMDLMIYQLRDKTKKPILYFGSIMQHGAAEVLTASEFSIQPGKNWTSKKTGITYPVEWTIQVPKKNINISTQSIIKNSEFDARLTSHNIYWEGAVTIDGTHTGLGFMELYGYTNITP